MIGYTVAGDRAVSLDLSPSTDLRTVLKHLKVVDWPFRVRLREKVSEVVIGVDTRATGS